ncbi:MAG TPA: hypothetical protein VH250_05530 [Granulicella sp.]|jgi:hypothetical protein|nr:hypothetical protein [Granulicella sp.]
MKRSNRWLRPEDRCSLPSPRLYPTRVAGLVFNFSETAVPDDCFVPSMSTTHPIRRRRPTSASAQGSLCEHASAS